MITRTLASRTLPFVLALASATTSAQALNINGPQPTFAGQIGTSEVQRRLDVFGNELFTKRVGVIAYCADIAPNADDGGIFGRQEFQKGGNPILDTSTIGFFGAQNIVDMIMYDDDIPRFRDVVLIDGDRERPTADFLAENFDCVIAYTDNQCGIPIPPNIRNSAAKALADFAEIPDKGVVLTGFSFNTSIGFGNAIFANGLSPITRSSPAVDIRCTPPDPNDPARGACPIGQCPTGATRQFPAGFTPPQTGVAVTAPECFRCSEGTNVVDANGLDFCACNPTGPLDANNFCGIFARPRFQPVTETPDLACESLLEGVFGPTSSSFANELTDASLAPGATLCANYDSPAGDLPLIAVNEARNVVGLNLFPGYAPDLEKTWFACIVANAAIYACGERRCDPSTGRCR